ncbi:hypothetical protein S1OALGB6SA_1490 [Olavius algarvensis spirochete endosymbiont]|nr:hypothetical protein S1OALGB6SA_1490 [Olavius algarvensis spirochete endosymbiont]
MGSIVTCRGCKYLINVGAGYRFCNRSPLELIQLKIRGVFIAHAHNDHFAALTSLLRGERGMRVYSISGDGDDPPQVCRLTGAGLGFS